MAKKTPLMSDFRSGETAPGLGARSDLDAYSRGCLVMKNCMPLIEGGVERVPGTYYVKPVKQSDEFFRIITEAGEQVITENSEYLITEH